MIAASPYGEAGVTCTVVEPEDSPADAACTTRVVPSGTSQTRNRSASSAGVRRVRTARVALSVHCTVISMGAERVAPSASVTRPRTTPKSWRRARLSALSAQTSGRTRRALGTLTASVATVSATSNGTAVTAPMESSDGVLTYME